VAKSFEKCANQTEKWYGTKYCIEKIPENKLSEWREAGLNDKFRLPARNEFIPTNLEVVSKASEKPQIPQLIKVCCVFQQLIKVCCVFLQLIKLRCVFQHLIKVCCVFHQLIKVCRVFQQLIKVCCVPTVV